jgi:hypothetical protein
MRIVALSLALLALGSVLAADLSAQATGPIKIGFVSPLSGAIARPRSRRPCSGASSGTSPA